jgi:hypothetical protein
VEELADGEVELAAVLLPEVPVESTVLVNGVDEATPDGVILPQKAFWNARAVSTSLGQLALRQDSASDKN